MVPSAEVFGGHGFCRATTASILSILALGLTYALDLVPPIELKSPNCSILNNVETILTTQGDSNSFIWDFPLDAVIISIIEVCLRTAVAGQTVTYILTITNSGVMADSFDLIATDPTWATILSTSISNPSINDRAE